MNYEIILKPVIGAIIGYSTNWLAIKMLFRPYKEKYIGKVKLPFTPGVIPRERGRIAKSLGQAVGQKLLTEDVIKQELLSDQVRGHIKAYVTEDLLGEEIHLSEVLKPILKDQYDAFTLQYSRSINEELIKSINGYMGHEQLTKLISGKVASLFPYEMMMADLMNNTNKESLVGVVENHYETISAFVVEQLQLESVKAKIGALIMQIVSEKVGPLGAMFINPEEMSEAIVTYVEDVLAQEETKVGLIATGAKAIDQVSLQKVSDIIAMEDYISLVEVVSSVMAEEVISYVNETDFISVIHSLFEKLLSKPVQLKENDKLQIEEQVEVLYEAFVMNNIPVFLETFNVADIVESEVDRFSVEEVESLIFNIIDKELKTITRLGGVLGFIIGLVYIIL